MPPRHHLFLATRAKDRPPRGVLESRQLANSFSAPSFPPVEKPPKQQSVASHDTRCCKAHPWSCGRSIYFRFAKGRAARAHWSSVARKAVRSECWEALPPSTKALLIVLPTATRKSIALPRFWRHSSFRRDNSLSTRAC